MLGFEGVDIGLFEGRSHLQPSREFESLARSARALAAKVEDRGLKVADVFLQTDMTPERYALNHPHPRRRAKARDWFLRTLEYANRCNSKHVTFIAGVPFKDESRSASYGRSVDELPWYLDQAQAHGVSAGVEPAIGSIVACPMQAEELIRDVPGLTLTLDYTHFTRAGLPDEQVEPLLAHTSHFHVRGARKGRLQVNFNDNVIDYRRVLRRMKEVGYSGWLCIEYVHLEWERCDECDNLSETILFRDFIMQAMREVSCDDHPR